MLRLLPAGATPGRSVFVPHASEIVYVFADFVLLNAEESALATTMAGYWTNYAKTGDPNSGNAAEIAAGTHWPKYSAAVDKVIRLDVASAGGVTVQAGLRKAACDFQTAAAGLP